MADEVTIPWYRDWAKIREVMAWALNVIQLIGWCIAIAVRDGEPIPPPPEPSEPVIVRGQGWVAPTEQEVAQATDAIAAFQGAPAQMSRYVADLAGGDQDQTVLLFDAEQKVLKKVLDSWDQLDVGACVGFGTGRAIQDLILVQIVETGAEQWPDAEVDPVSIYAGSRVEIGGGKIRGDGSVGAWAIQYVQRYGVLFRKKYGDHDLTNYSTSRAREWGRKGVPDELEAIAREHPVKSAALVKTTGELWAALGNRYAIQVCSQIGFEGRVPDSGVMSPRGTWTHCMCFRGRFVNPQLGKCIIVQNSWDGYLRKRVTVETVDRGRVELPEGCFAITLATAGRMLAANDTWAISSIKGFEKKQRDWPVRAVKPKRDLGPMFAWAH